MHLANNPVARSYSKQLSTDFGQYKGASKYYNKTTTIVTQMPVKLKINKPNSYHNSYRQVQNIA